ncbi:MAG: alkaline phosphatase family protein, partial [Muribaculaceae bacterium]|nr:alkaline phosphatase family protein [Muribaculaceae bacterium]
MKRMSDRRISSRLLGSLIMGLMTINVAVATDSARPKLVVGIVVDQLRTDYLQYLRQLFGESGFKRLMKDGLYLQHVDFQANMADPVAATALLYTGNYAPASGVSSARIYRIGESGLTPVLEDKGSMGNFTREALSPVNLRLSTISDEVAIDGAGLTSVYAIAPDAQQAIIMAGHAGNCALWINDTDGKWSSTAYYRDFPQFVTRRNQRSPLSQRLDTLSWQPMLKPDRYPGVSAAKRNYPFRYTYPQSDREVWRRFKSSAPVNAEVTDVAIDAIDNLRLGTREDGIDMLSVGYTAAPYKYVADGDCRFELEDTYIRLDAQLGRLLQAIDRKVGLDNALIFLSSTGYYDDAIPDDPRYRIPTGDVSLKRVESLLNSYLSAKYGNADYVSGICGTQIYLDPRALESHSLSREQAQTESRDFLVRMSGIADARTLGQILSDPSEESLRQRRSIDPKTAGDIFLTILPGWNLVDDTRYPSTTTPIRAGMVSTPFFMLGPDVRAEVVTTPVDAALIAPTVTSQLHI